MSLALQLDNVQAVLLGNKWYIVARKSFTLDAYEYLWGEQIVHGGGNSDICAIGFMFRTLIGEYMTGPLSSIQAVKYLPTPHKSSS